MARPEERVASRRAPRLPRARLCIAMLAACLAGFAGASSNPEYEARLVRAGDVDSLYRYWLAEPDANSPAMQERIANLLLGPHGHAVKAGPHEGVQFLYRAALNGRPAAMRRLAAALEQGGLGLEQRPDAARCWSDAAAGQASGLDSGLASRLACARLTSFREPRARVDCRDLRLAKDQLPHHMSADVPRAVAAARLCAAAGTPVLLVPGPPPGKRDIARVQAYARHGITLEITGDVYDPAFERFRDDFNTATVAEIEAQRGKGYMTRLSKEIEADLPPT